jgi:hypothetical protein
MAVSMWGCADPCVDDGLGQTLVCEANSAGEEETSDSATYTDTNDTGDEGNDGGLDCPLAEVDLSPQTPTIMTLVDRSSSMVEDFNGVTRWDAIGTTLFDPDVGVVPPLQSDIRFGLALYDNPEALMMCPRVESVAPDLNALTQMQALYDGAMPEGDTPTGAALTEVATEFADYPHPGDKVIVLATDGEPDTCEQPNPNEGQAEAVAAAEAAFDLGIRTVVVSVGADISAQHLQDMANAGAGVADGDPDATYYQALDQQSLIDAFSDIIAGVRECTIDLDSPLPQEAIPLCEVTINGEPVPYDDPNGWELQGDQQVELLGEACDSIQDGAITIEMNCDCEALE